MNVPGPDDLFKCPYDSTHMVRYQRMPYHIALCRKRNPCTTMATCHFNALHHVLKPELRYHLSVCPDRYRIHNDIPIDKNQSGTYIKGCTDLPQYKETVIHRTEDWDSEAQNNKIFVWGESYKYDPDIVGYCKETIDTWPDDYCNTMSSERDSYLAQILREKHLKTKVLEGNDGSFTRLPKDKPKVLARSSRFTTTTTQLAMKVGTTCNQAKALMDLTNPFKTSLNISDSKPVSETKVMKGELSSTITIESSENQTKKKDAVEQDQASCKKDDGNNVDEEKNKSDERNE